jgi:enoyl-CoA hydratase/carnithine racemase
MSGLLVSREASLPNVLIMTLNRPKVLNALDDEVCGKE